jgi:hypothetical protein
MDAVEAKRLMKIRVVGLAVLFWGLVVPARADTSSDEATPDGSAERASTDEQSSSEATDPPVSSASPSSDAGESISEESDARPTGEPATPLPQHHHPEDVRSGPIPFSGDLDEIDPELAENLLGRLCPESPVRAEGDESGEWVCPVCPSFTSRAAIREEWGLTRVARGDFFEKDRDEIFAVYEGCEGEHAAGGGAVMFRRREGRWEVFYRHPALKPQQCLDFESAEHRDRLVCRVRARGTDGQIIERLMDTGGEVGMRRLIRSLDNTATCPSSEFVSSYLAGWSREDVDDDGRPDLKVEKIQRWRGLGDKKKVCSFAEAGGKWSRHRRLEIVYQFDGDSLRREDVRTETVSATLEQKDGDKRAKSSQ